MFYGWLGYALRSRMRLMEGYNYLRKSLEFAEEIEHQKLTGYACAWLAVTCADLGFFDEAISYGNRAYDMSELLQSDQRFLLLTLNALGTIYYMKGDSKKFDEFGKTLLIKGEKESNIRFTATGNHMVACSCFLAGDHPSAIESWEKSIRHLVDPIWIYHVKCLLAVSYLHENQLEEAENVCQEIVRHSETFGAEVWGTPAQGLLGIISITKGNLGKGVGIVKHIMELWLESGSKYLYIVGCYLLGKIYIEIAQGGDQKNFSFLIKNIGFLIKNFPFAQRKAQGYFNKAIEVAKEIGANGILGQVYLDLGLSYKAEKKTKKARKCICDAIDLFKQCNAYVYQKQAEEALTSLE